MLHKARASYLLTMQKREIKMIVVTDETGKFCAPRCRLFDGNFCTYFNRVLPLRRTGPQGGGIAKFERCAECVAAEKTAMKIDLSLNNDYHNKGESHQTKEED